MDDPVHLSAAALTRIKHFMEMEQYPAAYQIIIDETVKASYSGRKWFIAASSVNQGKGYTSAFIKTYTQLAKLLNNETCHTFTDDELQRASNEIAKAVLKRIIDQKGVLPTFEEIMEIDSETAITTLKLTPTQWAGTPVAPLAGYRGPIPDMAHDWLIVFRASYHAVLSAIFDGTADYIQAFFQRLIKREQEL